MLIRDFTDRIFEDDIRNVKLQNGSLIVTTHHGKCGWLPSTVMEYQYSVWVPSKQY